MTTHPSAPSPRPTSPLRSEGGEGARHIRSFVLRQGRFTPAQQRAFELHWQRFGVEPTTMPPDWAQVFGRSAPLVLEIGFGNGEQLLHAGMHETERDFIGIEVHRPGVGRLMNALAAHNVENVRLYNHDAIEVLQCCIAEESLTEVRIYFPDPWPKKRQQKRRLIQPAFAEQIASRVRAGGRLHLATDWADYSTHMLETLDASPHWRNVAGDGATIARPDWRIETHFEKRGLRLGHGVWDLLYERR
jgi:tRNA (guanine-N7-)-methyltransferase